MCIGLKNMGTNVVALKLLLHLVFSANALNLTYSSEFHDKGDGFKNTCVTNGRIICELRGIGRNWYVLY